MTFDDLRAEYTDIVIPRFKKLCQKIMKDEDVSIDEWYDFGKEIKDHEHHRVICYLVCLTLGHGHKSHILYSCHSEVSFFIIKKENMRKHSVMQKRHSNSKRTFI